MKLHTLQYLDSQRGIIRKSFLLFIAFFLFVRCEDFVQISPPKDQLVTETVFSDDASAVAAISGIYGSMWEGGFASGGYDGMSLIAGLSADEFTDYYNVWPEISNNDLTATDFVTRGAFWDSAYKYIWYCNSVIDGLSKSSALTDNVKNALEGEAKFLRAFCHFYLVNLYGDVPLITTPDYQSNAAAPRTSKDEIYNKIKIDLLDASALLPEDFTFAGNQRVRATKWAALAMLARVYLYLEDWSNAELQATTVIQNTTLFGLETNLENVFLKGSKEAIWQLMPIYEGSNTNEALVFVMEGYVPAVSLGDNVVSSFEPDDNRLSKWIGTFDDGISLLYYPNKYKLTYSQPLNEYSIVLRLAELYLIRAEARVKQNDLDGAIADLNIIRSRAGLSNTTATTADEIILAIEKERVSELFAEWGHRWLDLKRTNRVDEILGSLKNSWQSTDALYPIPQRDIDNNPNLRPQNPGY